MTGIRDYEEAPSTRRVDWIGVVTVTLAVLGWLIAGMRSYGADTSGLANRITALETRQAEDGKRMERIENKIDRLLERK